MCPQAIDMGQDTCMACVYVFVWTWKRACIGMCIGMCIDMCTDMRAAEIVCCEICPPPLRVVPPMPPRHDPTNYMPRDVEEWAMRFVDGILARTATAAAEPAVVAVFSHEIITLLEALVIGVVPKVYFPPFFLKPSIVIICRRPFGIDFGTSFSRI